MVQKFDAIFTAIKINLYEEFNPGSVDYEFYATNEISGLLLLELKNLL